MSTLNAERRSIETENERNGRSMLAVNLALVANIFLALIKTTIGITGHSPALLADGVMSTSDVAYNLVVAIFVRLSNKPADREHPFGHNQLESIAALTIGAFILTTGIGIFWDAVNAVYDQLSGQLILQPATLLAFWAAVLSIGMKVGLFWYTNRIGKRYNNPAVVALAYDHRNDIFSAAAALVGITLGRAGFAWVDPLAGALVALVVLRTGAQILRDSASGLMDTVPGEALEKQVVETLKLVPGVCRVEDVNAHRFGPYLVIYLTICVDGDISVRQGDDITAMAEKKLKESIQFLRVAHIHYHPAQVSP